MKVEKNNRNILAIFSLFIATITFILYVSFDLIGISKKDIKIELVNLTTPINTNFGNLKEISFVYDGVPIDNVSIATFEIFNNGRTPILPDDFISPIVFSVPKGGLIYKATITQSSPEDIFSIEELIVTESSVQIPNTLLNKNDRYTIEIIVWNIPILEMENPIRVNARVVDIKSIEITKRDLGETESDLFQVIAILVALIATIFSNISTVKDLIPKIRKRK